MLNYVTLGVNMPTYVIEWDVETVHVKLSRTSQFAVRFSQIMSPYRAGLPISDIVESFVELDCPQDLAEELVQSVVNSVKHWKVKVSDGVDDDGKICLKDVTHAELRQQSIGRNKNEKSA